MQVYQGMDIGTAKPSPEDRHRVRHYMIDLVPPEAEYTAAEFQRQARQVLDSEKHETVLVVGGSGLHFRAVIDPHNFPPHDPATRVELDDLPDPAAELVAVDPGAGGVVDLANRRRVVRALEVHRLTGLTPTVRASSREADALRRYQPQYPFRAAGIDPGAGLEQRIAIRVDQMRDLGFMDEVRALQNGLGRTSGNAVGYRQLLDHVQGRIDVEAAWARVHQATLGLARRQRTFFRRDPRVVWVHWKEPLEDRVELVRQAWGLG